MIVMFCMFALIVGCDGDVLAIRLRDKCCLAIYVAKPLFRCLVLNVQHGAIIFPPNTKGPPKKKKQHAFRKPGNPNTKLELAKLRPLLKL